MALAELSPADHALVSAAVAEAEAASSGEIVTIVADASDRYHDVALHWAVAAMLGLIALAAAFPALLEQAVRGMLGPWSPDPSTGQLLTALLLAAAATFLLILLPLRLPALRLALTPGATKTRRVRRRAVELFRAGAEQRTAGRTGILLYVSRAERRAEIVADEAIHAKVAPEVWGEAMAAVVDGIRAGRPGEGIAAGVRVIGAVLAGVLPRAAADTDEIPNRLIEL